MGFDLRLISWRNGTELPETGKNLVVVGIDDNGLLHIRIFDATGNRRADTDETQLPAQAAAVAALKQQLPRLLSAHVVTDADKAQVLTQATSIVGQTHGMRSPTEGLNELFLLRGSQLLLERFPNDGKGLTFESALEQAAEFELASQYGRLLDIWAAVPVMRCPVIAVCGELNSGKSSVVASFLSPEGQNRVPRGVENAKGTHRFVYWIPSKWNNDDLVRHEFMSMLQAAHGHTRVEYLSQDLEVAAEQYKSGRDHPQIISTPLVSEDPRLDQLEFALLDCPDVQTYDRDGGAGDEKPGWEKDGAGDNEARRLENEMRRLEFVAQAARLCSAFFFVWSRATVRDRLFELYLGKLRQRMGGVPLYLLINMVRPQKGQPGTTLQDSNIRDSCQKFQVKACYVAFDFDIDARGDQPGWRDLTPKRTKTKAETDHADSADTRPQFPEFFAPECDGDRITANRFLAELPHELSPGELQLQAVEDHFQEARKLIVNGLDRVESWVNEERKRTLQARSGLFDLCAGQFRDDNDEPLQKLDKDFIQGLMQSFLSTAPWYLRPGLHFLRIGHRMTETARDAANKARGWVTSAWRSLSQGLPLEPVKQELESQGIQGAQFSSPKGLAEKMHAQRWMAQVAPDVTIDSLEKAWTSILKEFSKFKLDVDLAKLDEITRSCWDGLTKWQKVKAATLIGLAGTLGIVAAIAGAVLVVIDGGATLLMTFSLPATVTHWIPLYALGAKGVATIAGAIHSGAVAPVIAGAGLAAGYSLAVGALRQNTLPSLAALFALACDAFHLPRRIADRDGKDELPQLVFSVGNNEFPLPRTDHLPEREAVLPLAGIGIYELKSEAVAEFRKVIDG